MIEISIFIGLLIFVGYFIKTTRDKVDEYRNERDEFEKKYHEIERKHIDFINEMTDKFSKKISDIEETSKRKIDERVQKVVEDYEEALKVETNALEEQVSNLDKQLGDKIAEITQKNTLYFTCACDRSKQIPCFVDLGSDENYFTCPDCGAVYRIVLNPSSVLMSGIVNNSRIANMYDGVEIGEIERTAL